MSTVFREIGAVLESIASPVRERFVLVLVNVSATASVPAITGGVGVCHTYVDASADMDMAVNIVHNAKTSNPSVCNALDTVIVHSSIAKQFLSQLSERWSLSNVKMKCDNRALSILGPIKHSNAERASDEDWDIEHLSLTIGVKIVDSLNEALAHIEHHGSGHSEAILSLIHICRCRRAI